MEVSEKLWCWCHFWNCLPWSICQTFFCFWLCSRSSIYSMKKWMFLRTLDHSGMKAHPCRSAWSEVFPSRVLHWFSGHNVLWGHVLYPEEEAMITVTRLLVCSRFASPCGSSPGSLWRRVPQPSDLWRHQTCSCKACGLPISSPTHEFLVLSCTW